jgi:hypothetical protein
MICQKACLNFRSCSAPSSEQKRTRAIRTKSSRVFLGGFEHGSSLCIQRDARLRRFPSLSGCKLRALPVLPSTAPGRSAALVHIEKYRVLGGQDRSIGHWQWQTEEEKSFRRDWWVVQ